MTEKLPPLRGQQQENSDDSEEKDFKFGDDLEHEEPISQRVSIKSQESEQPDLVNVASRQAEQDEDRRQEENKRDLQIRKEDERKKENEQAAQKNFVHSFDNNQVLKDMFVWKNVIWFVVWITIVTLVVILLILMFMNCVPQANGIELTAGVSIAYFCLTIFNLIMLFGIQYTTNFGVKETVRCNQGFSLFWGLVLLALGITLCVLELPPANREENAKVIWKGLSSNQQEFFNNELTELVNTRLRNTAIVGGSLLGTGVLFIVIGSLMFPLYNTLDLRESNLSDKKQEAMQLPFQFVPKGHEQVRFVDAGFTPKEHDAQYQAMQVPLEQMRRLREEKRRKQQQDAEAERRMVERDDDMESDYSEREKQRKCEQRKYGVDIAGNDRRGRKWERPHYSYNRDSDYSSDGL